jgi:hypothetical protein
MSASCKAYVHCSQTVNCLTFYVQCGLHTSLYNVLNIFGIVVQYNPYFTASRRVGLPFLFAKLALQLFRPLRIFAIETATAAAAVLLLPQHSFP